MPDALVTVEHRHREEDRTDLPGPKEDRCGLGRRRGDDCDAVAALYPVRAQDVRGPCGERLHLPPGRLALDAPEVLEDHRQLVAGVLVADVRCDVVAGRDLPSVTRASFLVGLCPRRGRGHGLSSGCAARRSVLYGAELTKSEWARLVSNQRRLACEAASYGAQKPHQQAIYAAICPVALPGRLPGITRDYRGFGQREWVSALGWPDERARPRIQGRAI